MLKALTKPVLIGGLLMLLSLALPQTVETQEELRAVKFGLPLRFVQQDVTAVARVTPTPVWISSPWEHPTEIHWQRMLGSWLILSAVLFIGQQVLFAQRPSFSA